MNNIAPAPDTGVDDDGNDGHIIISNQATSITLSTLSSPSTYGTLVTFTATVTNTSTSSTPTGTVTFQDSSTSIGTGILSGSTASATATYSTLATQLGAGSHTITAQYYGDTGFDPCGPNAFTDAGSESEDAVRIRSERELPKSMMRRPRQR